MNPVCRLPRVRVRHLRRYTQLITKGQLHAVASYEMHSIIIESPCSVFIHQLVICTPRTEVQNASTAESQGTTRCNVENIHPSSSDTSIYLSPLACNWEKARPVEKDLTLGIKIRALGQQVRLVPIQKHPPLPPP